MKAKVPKGSRQRRRASNTKLIVKAVINRISVIPRVGELFASMIGQGVINGEAYSVKKVSSEKVKVSERMAGPSCRQDGVPLLACRMESSHTKGDRTEDGIHALSTFLLEERPLSPCERERCVTFFTPMIRS